MPTWKEIAWQLEKQGSPLVGCLVRVGVIACPCFLWAVWTCPQNTWHACNDFVLCLGPSRPPTLVVPSLTCVQNTYYNHPQPPWETKSSLQAGTEENPSVSPVVPCLDWTAHYSVMCWIDHFHYFGWGTHLRECNLVIITITYSLFPICLFVQQILCAFHMLGAVLRRGDTETKLIILVLMDPPF